MLARAVRTPVASTSRARRLAGPLAVAGAAVACGVFVLLADPTTPGGPTPLCPTYALLGVTCPGCGSARMLYSVLTGDLGAALRYNALGIVALVVLAGSYARWARDAWRGPAARRGLRWHETRWGPPVVLGMTVGWFVVRLLPMEPFSALAL